MMYKTIIEFRPRLRACQFYIVSNCLSDVINLKITKNSIIFDHDKSNVQIQLPEDIFLIPDSLSGLRIMSNWMSFRLQSEPHKICGSFRTEILPLNKPCERFEQYSPEIEVNTECNLYCRCCSYQVMKDPVCFERILPLPGTNFDSVDLFCHGSNKVFSTEPKSTDCLYGSFFIKLEDKLIPNINKVFYCKRCLSWLGITESKSVLLWNSTVSFSPKPVSNVQNQNVALSDFINLVKTIMVENIGKLCKILMYCKISESKVLYLYLWVLEANLQLLFNMELTSEISGSQLQKGTVIKVLYKFENTLSDFIENSESDIYTHQMPLSKPMLIEGLKHLTYMSSLIPDEFRTTNDMNVSYLGKLF